MNQIFVLLLLLGTTFGATHVNISIAQQTVTSPVDGNASADLKTNPEDCNDSKVADGEERSAKLQADSQNSNFRYEDDADESDAGPVAQFNSGFSSGGRSARVQLIGSSGQSSFAGETFVDGRTQGYNSNLKQEQEQQFSQLRQQKEQEKKNLEFERYIQRHHSVPTVETVYDAASNSRSQQPSSPAASSSPLTSSSSRLSKTSTFERQIALPANLAEGDRHVLQPKPVNEPSQENILPSAAASSDIQHQSSNANNNNYPEQNVLDQSNYNYNGGQQADSSVQYPPSVDESHPGYGGYSNSEQSGFYGGSQNSNSDFYPSSQPSYQPPVVTKTIQIAQPALKAKKFEVRHPAIQKEFYDIEERVLIKPAGTVVVELNHPVAKIPKGESILPLGHPHPAIANAYSNHNAQGTSQHQVSSSASFSSSNNRANVAPYNNQYSPSPIYSPKPVREGSTIDSSISSTPTFDHKSRIAAVEASLKGESSFAPAVESKRTQEQQNQDAYFIATDSQGNQRQISAKKISPNMFNDPSEFRYPGQSSGSPSYSQQQGSSYSNSNNNYGYLNQERRAQPSQAAAQSDASYNGQLNFYSSTNDNSNNANLNDRDQFKAEYVDGPLSDRESVKPARLREPSAPKETVTHVIKHEHNILLPPSQHNIYLGRLEQMPATVSQQSEQKSAQLKSSRFEGEAARVLEIKPYLQRARGSVVAYAPTTLRPFARYTDSGAQSDRARFQSAQYRSQFSSANNGQANGVQYSAPYSKMRYDPEQQSARLTYNKLYAAENAEPSAGSFSYDRSSGVRANLRAESDQKAKLTDEATTAKVNDAASSPALKTVSRQQNTHIQIQIPHLSEEADKQVVVSSTISPPSSKERSEKYRLPAASSSSFEPSSSSSSSSSSSQQRFGKYRSSAASGFVPALRQEQFESSRFGPSSNEERSEKYRLSSSSSFVPSSNQPRSGNYRSSSNFERTDQVDSADAGFRERQYSESARFGNLELETKPDCDEEAQPRSQQKFMRITEPSEAGATGAAVTADSSASAQPASTKPSDVEVSPNSAASQLGSPAGSRIIAASAAPTDTSSHSESFHKRRIVVNHPFQTVREVVEHEPYTNYHQIQVNEPASPAHYRVPFLETHGSLKQVAAAAPIRDVTFSYNQRPT